MQGCIDWQIMRRTLRRADFDDAPRAAAEKQTGMEPRRRMAAPGKQLRTSGKLAAGIAISMSPRQASWLSSLTGEAS